MAVDMLTFEGLRRDWLAAVDARRAHVDDCFACLVEWLPNCQEGHKLAQAADDALARYGDGVL